MTQKKTFFNYGEENEGVFKFKKQYDDSLDITAVAANFYNKRNDEYISNTDIDGIQKQGKVDMDGSTLLNQGGYGCVYHPAIRCDDNKNNQLIKKNSNHYISKIQFNDKSSKNEIEIGKLIKNINNYNNFFAPIVSSCSIDINRIDKDLQDVYGEKCAIYEKEKRKNLPFIMLSIPFIKDGNFNRNIVNSKKSFSFISLIDSYKHLLNALLLLNHTGIIHYDLKSDNVLFNKIKNQPIIIDFGLSIDFNQVKKLLGYGKRTVNNIPPTAEKLMRDKFYVFAPDYYLWCIEIHVICYLLDDRKNVINDDSIKLICSEYVKTNKAFIMFDNSFKEQYTKSCEKFLSQYNGHSRDKIIISLLEFHETWDNFSLSIMYLKLLFSTFKFQTSGVILFFYKILLHNINPNPRKRLSINDTIISLFDLYSNENVEIDEIIKMFVGTDIDTIELKSMLTEDEKHFYTVLEKFNNNKQITTITK